MIIFAKCGAKVVLFLEMAKDCAAFFLVRQINPRQSNILSSLSFLLLPRCSPYFFPSSILVLFASHPPISFHPPFLLGCLILSKNTQKSIKSPFFLKLFVTLLFFPYFCLDKRHKNVHLGKVPPYNRGIPFL